VDVQVLSRIAATRLQKELTEWQVNPPCGFEHKVTESLQGYGFSASQSFVCLSGLNGWTQGTISICW
jgi:hypothetical protein